VTFELRIRAWQKIAIASMAALLSLSIGAALVAPLAAKRALVHAAQTKGWAASTVGGHVGLRGIWFDRLSVEAERGASFHAELGPTCIHWSSLLGKRRLSVTSGRVEVVGALNDVKALLRGKEEHRNASVNGAGATELGVYHVDVEWRERAEEKPRVSLDDLQVEKSQGQLTARVSDVRASVGATAIELRAVSAERTSEPDRTGEVDGGDALAVPVRASAAEVIVQYATSTSATSNPGAAGSAVRATSTGPAKSATAAATNGAKKPAGSTASDPAASTRRELLSSFAWLIDEVEHLRTQVTGAADHPEAKGTEMLTRLGIGSNFESKAFRLRLVDLGQKLELGPFPLSAERRQDEISISVTQNATQKASALSLVLTVADGFSQARMGFSAGPITLSQLGVSEGDFGLEDVGRTQLEFVTHAEYLGKPGEVSLDTKGRVDRLSIRQPFLARETIRNIGFEWEGATTLNSEKRQLKTDLLRLSVGPVSAQLRGSVELGRDYQVIDSVLETPLAACQDLVNVLPDGFAPLLRGWQLDRSFAFRLAVNFDSRKPAKSVVGLKLDNDCRVVSVPKEVAPARFEQPFSLEVEDERGVYQSMAFGPGTWGWTNLAEISPYVESAVLVCEDGRFLRHDGIDREAVQNSIRENLRTGRFARGASTISMQLAKNLYLRRDKTIARKLQEAALTMLLEQSQSKHRLLELYLNVIEFGPGIYGIGPAAKHYFETTPDRLTLAQSFFLISILPNPKPSRFGPDGMVRPGWMKLVRSLMGIARRRGHITDAELEAGLAEELALHAPGNPASIPTRRILQDPRTGFDDEPVPTLEDEF
jgi:hypothetical protein